MAVGLSAAAQTAVMLSPDAMVTVLVGASQERGPRQATAAAMTTPTRAIRLSFDSMGGS